MDSRPVQRNRGGPRRFQPNRFQQQQRQRQEQEAAAAASAKRQPRKQQQKRNFQHFQRNDQRVSAVLGDSIAGLGTYMQYALRAL